jgi:hypothetical protein
MKPKADVRELSDEQLEMVAGGTDIIAGTIVGTVLAALTLGFTADYANRASGKDSWL